MTTESAQATYTIRIEGDVSGMVAAGDYVYQQQVNVEEGGLVYVIEGGRAPYQKVKQPVRLIPRAGPDLIGRREEMGSLIDSIRSGAFIVVSGPRGIGKSLLLSHFAHADMASDLASGTVHMRAQSESFEDIGQRLFYAFHDSLLPTPFVAPPAQIQRELASVKATIIIDEIGNGEGIETLLDLAAHSAFVFASEDPSVQSEVGMSLSGLPIEDSVELFNREVEGSFDEADLSELCRLLAGHPQCVILAARLVKLVGTPPAALAVELGSTDPCNALANRCLSELPNGQERIAQLLAALNGAPASDQILSLATKITAGEPLAGLHQRGVAVSASPTHRLNPSLQSAAEDLWDLNATRAEIAGMITDWLTGNESVNSDSRDHAVWLQTGIQMVEWADETKNNEIVLSLGVALEGHLATSGRWGAWQSVLESVQRAALNLADGQAAYAFTLHQLGTKALCYGQRSRAEFLLNDALRIRKRMGLESAAEATRHNLEVLNLPPQSPGGNKKIEPPDPSPTSFAKTVVAMAIGAAVAVGGWLGVSALLAGQGKLDVEPHELNMAGVVAGSEVTQQVFLGNSGEAALMIESLELDGSTAFRVAGPCGPGSELDPDESCELQIAFEPDEPGEYTAALLVVSTGEIEDFRIPIRGQALAPARLEVAASVVDFGVVDAGLAAERSLDFANSGDVALILEPLRLDRSESFVVVDTNCGPVLEPQRQCSAVLRFAPGREGSYSDTLTTTYQGGESVSVELIGIGVGEPEITISPSTVDFGEFRVDEPQAFEAVVQNAGTADAVLSLELVDSERFVLADHSCRGTLEPGDGCVARIEFQPMTVDQALAEFEVITTGIAEIRYVAPEKRYSGSLVVESDRGQRVEAPVTGIAVIPLPDLVVQLDSIEVEGFDDNDFPFYSVTADVANLGLFPSSSGVLGVLASIEDGDDVGSDTGLLIPLLNTQGEPIAIDNLEPGQPTRIEGTLGVPIPNLATGTLIRFSAVVDACTTEELVPPICGVRELNEENNSSNVVESTVGPRILIVFPFPIFPIEEIFILPFPTTTQPEVFE